jgi:hypothetical protein
MHPEPTEPREPTKFCLGCKRDRPRTEFHRRSAASDGLQYRCKDCQTDQVRERYHSSPAPFSKVRNRAAQRLIEAHPEEYQRYLTQERDRLVGQADTPG